MVDLVAGSTRDVLVDNLVDPPAPPGPLKRGFGAGVATLKAAGGGLLSLAGRGFGAVPLENLGENITAEANAEAAPLQMNVEDAYAGVKEGNLGAGVDFAKYAVGNVIPSALAMTATALIGRGFGSLLARGAATQGAATAARLKDIGTTAGAAAGSIGLETGSIFPEAVQSGVENPVARSLAGGTAAGLLDTVMPLVIARRLGIVGNAVNTAPRAAGFGTIAKGAAKTAVTTGAGEAATETAQSVIERMAAGQDLTGPDAISDYANSAAVGLVAGHVFGAPAGAIETARRPVAGTENSGRASVIPPVSVENPQEPVQSGTAVANPLQPPANTEDLQQPAAAVPFAEPADQPTPLGQARLDHEAALAQHTELANQVSTITGRLAALDSELVDPARARKKREIVLERRALASELSKAQEQVATGAAGVESSRAALKTQELLDAVPSGEGKVPKAGTIVPESGPLVAPGADPAVADPAAVAEIQRQKDASDLADALAARKAGTLLTTPQAKLLRKVDTLVPVPDAQMAVPAMNKPREASGQLDPTTAVGEREARGIVAATSAVRDIVAAKVEASIKGTPAKQAALTRTITDVVHGIVREAATLPTVEARQAAVQSGVKKALSGRVDAGSAQEIADAVGATLYSKGAVNKPRTFYRGIDPTGNTTQRIKTGDDHWDSHLFASSRMDRALDYSPMLERIEAAPDAKIVYQGSKEFRSLQKGMKLQRMSMLAFASEITKRAKAAGYDAVHFERQGDVGTAIINRDKFTRGLPVAQDSDGNYIDPGASKNSIAALTTEEFARLPDAAKNEVVDYYDRAMTERGQQLIARIRDMVGNDPHLTVQTYTAAPGAAIGGYTRTGPLKSLISLALNAKQELSVADHEGFHYAEDRILDGNERAVIRRALEPGRPLFKKLAESVQRYDAEHKTNLTDEILSSPAERNAYAFEFWKRGELQAEGSITQVFAKLREFLERVANFVKGQGFRSIEDVFTALDRGQYAERSRGAGGIAEIKSNSEGAVDDSFQARREQQLIDEEDREFKAMVEASKNADIARAFESVSDKVVPWVRSMRPLMQKAKALNATGVFVPHTGHDVDWAVGHADGIWKDFQKLGDESIPLDGDPISGPPGRYLIAHRLAQDVASHGAEIKKTIEGYLAGVAAHRAGLNMRSKYARKDAADIDSALNNTTTLFSKGAQINQGVGWSESRIDHLLRQYGYQDGRTAGAAAFISPAEFLQLTSKSDEHLRQTKDMLGGKMQSTVDLDALRADDQTPYLEIRQRADGEYRVVQHEGRGRAYAMRESGVSQVPVVLMVRDVNGDRVKAPTLGLKDGMTIRGQGELQARVASIQSPVDLTFDNREQVELTFGNAEMFNTLYSQSAAQATQEMERRYKHGELPEAQFHTYVAGLMDDAQTRPMEAREAASALAQGSVGAFKRARTYIATGNYISKFSEGYKNGLKALSALELYKNQLIAKGSEVGLSKWHAANQTDRDVTFDALLKRRIAGALEGTPEFDNIRAALTDAQRDMFDQVTGDNGTIAQYLRKERAAEAIGFQRVMTAKEFDDWQAHQTEQVQQLIDNGYVPERRYGDHVVRLLIDVPNADGTTRAVVASREQLETEAQAIQRERDYEKEIASTGSEMRVERGIRHKAEHDQELGIAQFLDLARRQGIRLQQTEIEKLSRALISADSIRRNRMMRTKHVPGYSKEGWRVLNEFITGMSGKIAHATFSDGVNAALAGKPVDAYVDAAGQPSVAINNDKAANLWVKDGPKSGFYRNILDQRADTVLSPTEGSEISTKLKTAAMTYFIGGSLGAGAVQMFSVPMNTVPYLAQHTSYTNAMATTLAAWGTTMKNSIALRDLNTLQNPAIPIPAVDEVPGLRAALITAAQDGTNSSTEIHQIMGVSRGGWLAQSKRVQKALDIWMWPFKFGENTSRIASFIAAYKIGQDGIAQPDGTTKKLGGRDLYEFAKNSVDETQNRFDPVNRPAIASHPIGSLLFMFKSFPLFVVEMIETVFRQNPKAATTMLLGLVAMTGVQGLPFAEDILDLVDVISQKLFNSPFNARRKMRNLIKDASEALVGVDASNLVMRGLVNEVTGLNIATRVGNGDIIPGTRIGAADTDYARAMEQILGAPLSMVIAGGGQLDNLAGGIGSALTKGDFSGIVGAMRAGGPVAVRNLIKGYEQLDKGFAQDALGRKLLDVSTADALWQGTGISSGALTKLYDLDAMDKQSSAFYKQAQSDFTRQLTKAMLDGDAQKAADVYKAMEDFTAANPEMPLTASPSSIRRQMVEAGLPLNARTLKMLPRALRGTSVAIEGL